VHIEVKLYATMRRYQPNLPRGRALPLEIPTDVTVAWVVQRLGIPDNVPLVAMVNSAVCALDCALSDGDTLSLFPPVTGG
jgi:molybdopterin synthase sulfur carrier subunit